MPIICEMTLGSRTLYFAEDDGIALDRKKYQPRIIDIPTIRTSIGSLHVPRHQDASGSLVLDDDESWTGDNSLFQLAADNNSFAASVFRFYEGRGSDKSQYTLFFTGRVRLPGGVSFDSDRCRIDLVEDTQRQNVGVPVEQFGPTHAVAPASFADYFIPRVFGDYRRAPEQYIPTINLGSRVFYICDPADLQAIGKVKSKDGTQYTQGTHYDYTAGDGHITFKASVNPMPTEVFVSVNGASHATKGDSGEGMMRWLIVNVLGESASAIDDTSFSAMGTNTSGTRTRGYFGEQNSRQQEGAIDILIKLAFDLFYDFDYTKDEKYSVFRRSVISGTISKEIGIVDLLNESRQDYVYAYDPERLLVNRVICNYALDPESDEYKESLQKDEGSSQANVGGVIPRSIDCPYFYELVPADNLATLQLAIFSQEIYAFGAQLESVRADIQKGEQIYVNINELERVPVQVRSVEWDLGERKTDIDTFALIVLQARLFAPDSIDEYDQETVVNQEKYAFYTEDDGDDSQSKYSIGGSTVPYYNDIADIVADTTEVSQGIFNQIRQNVAGLRAGGFRVGTMGFSFDVDLSDGVKPVILAKDDEIPERITLANADYRATFAELNPQTSDLPP